MYISTTDPVKQKPTVRWLKAPPRDDWNFEMAVGLGRYVYASYEELRSLWFEMGAALSEYEDERRYAEPIPLIPAFPPAVAEFIAEAHETRPRVDGVFPMGQDACLAMYTKHEWRWGTRTLHGADPMTRRYCVNCGTHYQRELP